MSQRDELAETIHTEICEESLKDHLDTDWPGHCVKAADAILAVGYVKADSEQWAYRREIGSVNSELMHRSVGYGPWEVSK
ncbi:hypothetical protein [Promicromonospora sukumoe]